MSYGELAMGMGVGLGQQAIGNYMQIGQNAQLINQQVAAQKHLTQFNNNEAYKQWLKTNYDAQRKQMEKAGLNIGLMYGGGGASGGTLQNNAGSVSSSSASNESGITQGMAMMLQAGLQEAQIENIKADTAKKLAETKTTDESRSTLVENMRQSGIETWFRNLKEKMLREGVAPEDEVRVMTNTIYRQTAGDYNELSPEVKLLNADLFKTEAEKQNLDANALLTNKKAEGYWQELLNDTSRADSDKIKATATKLAAEWTTGEYTNWKTWVDLARNAIQSLGGLIR